MRSTVIYSSTASQRHNNWDAVTKTDAGRLLRKIFTSPFIASVRKGCVGFYCERELETEHNWNILTPKLWLSALCLFRSLGLLNRSPGVHCAGCWLSLLHLISNFSGPQTPSGFPLGRVWLSLPHLVPLPLQLYCLTSVLTELYNSSTSTWSPTRSLKSNV